MSETYHIPLNWVEVPLEEIIPPSGVFCDGDWVESKDQDPNGDVRLIQLADIGDGKFVDKSDRYLTKNKAGELNCTFLEAGDLLIARMPDPLGRSCIFPLYGHEKYVTVVDVCIIRVSEAFINSKFLMFLINSSRVRERIEGYKSGSTRKRISRGNLAKVVLTIPPLNEQKRIIAKIEELFSELDRGVENLKTAREQLKVYRQAVLKHTFEGKFTARWREQNKGKLETADQLLERIKRKREAYYQIQLEEWKESTLIWKKNGKEGKQPSQPKSPDKIVHILEEDLKQLPKLPQGWMWIKLLNISKNIQIGPFGSLLHQHDYVAGGWPLVNPSHIKNQKIYPDYNLTITAEKLKELTNYRLQEGDVVMGRRGDMGRCAVVTKKEAGWLCGTGSLFVRLLDSYNPWYYCQALSSQRAKEHLSSSSIGTTMQNLNQKILDEMPVPVCSAEEQIEIMKEIERQFSIIDGLEETINSELQKSEALRQSILKKAFSGKLVAQDPNDEPASVMLERIHAEEGAKKTESKKPKAKRNAA